MTEIDKSTGLAKLPDRQFWRVTENAILLMERGAVETRTFRVIVDSSDMYVYPREYGVEQFISTLKEKNIKFEVQNVYQEVPSYTYWWFKSHKTMVKVPDKTIVTYEPEPTLVWRYLPEELVTEETLPRMTVAALNELDARNKRQAVFGDYPPKSLGGSSK